MSKLKDLKFISIEQASILGKMQCSKGKDIALGDLKVQLPISTRDALKQLLTDFSSTLTGDSTKDRVLVTSKNFELIAQLSKLVRFKEEDEENARKRFKLTSG